MAEPIHRSYKYRLYPTEQQKIALNQTFGCVRFLWNQLVANFNTWTPTHNPPKLTEIDVKNNPNFPWMKQVNAFALQQKRMDFEQTKSQIFNKKRKTKLGRMQFKKKGISNESFRIPGQAMMNLTANRSVCSTGKIQFPKMGPIKVTIDRPFTGKFCSATVSKNKCNQYFVSILVEEQVELKQNTNRSVGIDLGIKDFAILSNGIKIHNPKWFSKNQTKLKRAQQYLSRKTKGSARYNKQKLKVARIHNHIANQRTDFLQKLSTRLINQYDTIVIENLAVKNMVKNRKLAKSISDASWSKFVSMVKYKSNWYGRTFHQIDRFYPSSKTCSCCGHKMDSMQLDIREWTCPKCGVVHDRDVNAAVNILQRGLLDIAG